MSTGVTLESSLHVETEGVKSVCVQNLCEEEGALKRPLDDSCASNADSVKKAKPSKKKKFAILLSYCGQGYLGMQKNDGFKTIEGDLFDAFQKMGIVDGDSYRQPQLIQFQRAARTDKGVSAVRQLISLTISPSFVGDDFPSQMSSHLPKCIQVFAIKKVTGGFNSKIACDGRTYAYIMPTFAFAPIETNVTKDYRMPESVLSELNSVLALYKGTHNFHNFTSKRSPHDPSSKRYIIDFSCNNPFLVKEMEFVKITVKGQSFMLHQIRKMIGLAIAIMRGFADKGTLECAFSTEKVDVPMAPSLNLVLEEPHFHSYNRRYGDDGVHEPLAWANVEEEIETFCREQILPVIYNGEITENSMMTWLDVLPKHAYSVREDVAPRSATRSELGRAALAVGLENERKTPLSEADTEHHDDGN